MDFAMLDTLTPTSAMWDPNVRRCRNALGRFTGPPKNAAAAAKMLTDLGYTVTIQQGRHRYVVTWPDGPTREYQAKGLARLAKIFYEWETKRCLPS